MENRLQKLIDHFKYADNIYIVNELETLKIEIDIAIADAKIDVYKEVLS